MPSPISGYRWDITCTPANSSDEQSVALAKWVPGAPVDQTGKGDQPLAWKPRTSYADHRHSDVSKPWWLRPIDRATGGGWCPMPC